MPSGHSFLSWVLGTDAQAQAPQEVPQPLPPAHWVAAHPLDPAAPLCPHACTSLGTGLRDRRGPTA